jgi:hypothetical protein
VTTTRLDRVLTFGDQLSFLIPHEWIEGEQEPDHYLDHAPNDDSGWFLVRLITLRNPSKTLHELLAVRVAKEQGDLWEVGGNSVVTWEQLSHEDGTRSGTIGGLSATAVAPTLVADAEFAAPKTV